MPTTVEVLVESLRQAGTRFITGVPGEEGALDIIEAAHRRGMPFYLVKQESAGAMMASAWGELTGAPGVCLSTRGPGASNMVNGVAHAYLDHSPLIAISDQFPGHTFETGSHMRLDQTALYAPITKWNSTLHAESVHQQVRRAIRVATSFTPGPVHLNLPTSEKQREAAAYDTDAPLRPDHRLGLPDRQSLRPVLDLIGRSQCPIVLVGLGVYWADACASMVALAERLGAPVLTTGKCKGAIPEDHPLSAGCLWGGALEKKLIAEADLIITVGLDGVELQAKPWPFRAPLVALSSEQIMDAEVPALHEVSGDLRAILQALTDFAPEGGNRGERSARAYRANLRAAIAAPARGLSPQALFDVARSVLPRNTVASVDMGASRLIGAHLWNVYRPREFLVSSGLATMGYALPAAMAARMVYPDQPVVAFCGDGGFLMAVAELQTAVRENLPVTVVVLDDGELGAMRVRQDIKGLHRSGTQLGGFDWEAMARGFGAEGVVVDSEKALGDALLAAHAKPQVTLIAAKIDASGYVAQFKAMWGV